MIIIFASHYFILFQKEIFCLICGKHLWFDMQLIKNVCPLTQGYALPISSPLALHFFVVTNRQHKHCSKFDKLSTLWLCAVVHLGSSKSYWMFLIKDNQAFSPFLTPKPSLSIEGFKQCRIPS
jgi:hypothetical protein